jgi:hypothetical protein
VIYVVFGMNWVGIDVIVFWGNIVVVVGGIITLELFKIVFVACGGEYRRWEGGEWRTNDWGFCIFW